MARLDEVESLTRWGVMESVSERRADGSLVLEIVRGRGLLGFSAQFSCEDWALEPAPSLAGDPDVVVDDFLDPAPKSTANREEDRIGRSHAFILTLPDPRLNDAAVTVVCGTDKRGFVALCNSVYQGLNLHCKLKKVRQAGRTS